MMLTTFVIRGKGMRRRDIMLDGLLLSSTVAHVKMKIQAALDDTPDEIHMLEGGEHADDSMALSNFAPTGLSQLNVLIWYSEAEEVSKLEETKVELSQDAPQPLGEHLMFRPEWLALLTVGQAKEELLPPEEPRYPEQLPPPLLMRPRTGRRADVLAMDADLACLKGGAPFELEVYANIFLGVHMHRRACVLTVSGRMRTAEVESRIEGWLGSRPDELSLNVDLARLTSNRELEEQGVGSKTRVVAMAWYKSASNRDLPPRAFSLEDRHG